MEYEQEGQEEGGVMQRIKESPRTVSALIIILIVAAAIYAFSGDDNTQQTSQVGDDSVTVEEQGTASDTTDEDKMEEEEMAQEGEAMASPTAVAPSPVSQADIMAQSQTLPEATTTDEGYVEVAEAGNGLTHLARKATTRYLSDHSVDYSVTNEHRIYIEDYIKDHMERQPLSLGDSRTIPFSLITEAVAAAGELNNSQLHNLTQYTYVLH